MKKPNHYLQQFHEIICSISKLHLHHKIHKQKVKKKKSTVTETQRIIAITKERNYPLQKLITYELIIRNQLFDVVGFLKKEHNKSQLICLLERNYIKDEIVQVMDSDRDACLDIDVMLMLRKIKWKNNKTFKDLIEIFCGIVPHKVTVMKTKRIDFVFDSYFVKSIKYS